MHLAIISIMFSNANSNGVDNDYNLFNIEIKVS